MADSPDISLKILSLLDGEQEKRFSQGLIGKRNMEYFRKYTPELKEQPLALLDGPFWTQLSAETYDVIVLELNAHQIEQLHSNLSRQNQSGIWTEPAWSLFPAATIVLLTDSNPEGFEHAVHLGFDGVWMGALEDNTILDKLQTAITNARRRHYSHQRFNRMRQLCRKANRNRRHLRDKVDLLCRDLISSNVQFADTMLDLQRAYEFQTELTGEFDRRYLMYKALQGTKNILGECSSALFLCQSGQFEAHVAGLPQKDTEDIDSIEELLSTTVIPAVLESEQNIMLNESEGSSPLTPNQNWLLKNWSILALPVISQNQLQAVLVFYRHHSQRFTPADQAKLLPMLPPLAQALSSLSKLERYIHQQ